MSEYSNQISELLGGTKHSSDSMIEDPRMVLRVNYFFPESFFFTDPLSMNTSFFYFNC